MTTQPGSELRRLRALIADLDAVVWEADVASGRFTFVSQRAEDLLGWPRRRWTSEPSFWSDHIHPDDRDRVLSEFISASTHGRAHDIEYRFLARDDRVVWLRDIGHTVPDHRGDPLLVHGLMVDITRQKLAIERAEESESKYRSLVERIPAIVYIESLAKGSDEVFYISPQVEQILGVSQEDWVADPSVWFRLMHPDDRERVEELNRVADQTTQQFSAEYRLIATDGRTVWIRDEAAIVRDEAGTPKFWHGVMLDITERRRAEELEHELAAEREGAAELRALDETKNTFLQAVSHDLRTPLAAILGLAVTLERKEVELHPEEAKTLAGRIAANARKLDRMVADLLDLDRLSRGIVEPNLFPTDVGALVTRIVSEAEPLSGRKVALEIEPVMAETDAPKVERIVENLLANTARHTPREVPVWVRVHHEGDGVLIAVEDAGPGVSAEHREEIFEPFRRGPDTAEHAPGVGIGLALVALFAELHGGRAWVEDRPGGGASFRVFLPKEPPTS